MVYDLTQLPVADRAPDERTFWRKVARVAARIPFAEDLVAAWFCAVDPTTPTRVRAILFGALAYFVLPTDLIPDVVVGLGFLDDGTVLAAALTALGSHLRPEHRDRARARLEQLGR
jgi:uncharacterized membrane protein YkvA (DUF1232 family)